MTCLERDFLVTLMNGNKKQIISIPNFAYLSNRLDLLFHGVMPRPMLYGYTWYNTGHIHQLSVKDFKRFCLSNGMKIIEHKDFGFLSKVFSGTLSNFFSKESESIIRFE